MLRIALMFGLLALAGCGFSGQPKPHEFESSRTFAMPKAAVWQDVTAWFAGQPMTIGKADEASGQIIAEVRYPFNGGPADCGFDDSMTPVERLGKIQVDIQPVDAGNTTVAVYTTFRETRTLDPSNYSMTAECKSTGGVESAILAAVN